MRLAKSFQTTCFLTTLAGLVTLGGCDGGGGSESKTVVVDKEVAEKQGKATADFYKDPANKPKFTPPPGAPGTAPKK
jgi:hypothetical protein